MRARSLNVGSNIISIAQRFRVKSSYAIAAMAVLLATITPLGVMAVTPISQGYTTDERLSTGTLVSLEKDSADRIVPASNTNVDNLLGVVINGDSSLLSVSNGDNQAQVATSGTINVLVSDINGKIENGDHITASPISGVGMKASTNTRTIGIAQSSMRGDTKQKIKDASGKEQEVTLGQVSALVNVAYFFKEPERTVVPSAIQKVANALAGKEVNTLPILISAAIFIVTLIVAVSIIYSMIHSSIISVGRNPMSQSAIYRDLIQLSALVLAILGVGMVAIYLILTRL